MEDDKQIYHLITDWDDIIDRLVNDLSLYLNQDVRMEHRCTMVIIYLSLYNKDLDKVNDIIKSYLKDKYRLINMEGKIKHGKENIKIINPSNLP